MDSLHIVHPEMASFDPKNAISGRTIYSDIAENFSAQSPLLIAVHGPFIDLSFDRIAFIEDRCSSRMPQMINGPVKEPLNRIRKYENQLTPQDHDEQPLVKGLFSPK